MTDKKDKMDVNRRNFLKISGAAGAVLGAAGLGVAGYRSGKDPQSYLGWQSAEGADQYFDRKSVEVDEPTYQIVGETSRPDIGKGWSGRRRKFAMQWKKETGFEGLDPDLQQYYTDHPEDFELDRSYIDEIRPTRAADNKIYGHQFRIAEAWSNAMGAIKPPRITEPPEIADFPRIADSRNRNSGGTLPEPAKMKHPAKTSKLIKKIALELGSSFAGICKVNPDWIYKDLGQNRGFTSTDVPKHWEYAVVIGIPMSWDPMYANPNYGTSGDAYGRVSIVAERLAAFIKNLGYAARPHSPMGGYDLMVPPFAIDAGLGEQGRHGVVILPEVGCNVRPAVITTNLPVIPDKPIDFGVQDFCKTCKICAEVCPSGAIPFGDKVEVRGYRKYQLNQAKCSNFWQSNLGNNGCRLCIAVCPYTRKSNWMHKTARDLSIADPTGLMDKALLTMQKWMYSGPESKEYFMPSMGGSNASYRPPPWWLKAEDFIEP